jgi:ubiquinone/menaquinone biosynthesis C-methylase UbiE
MNAHLTAPQPSGDNPWEEAYLQFQTAEQEIRKFVKRLRKLGADGWDKSAEVVELFCGRGNGLHALHRLGFCRVEGVDRSAALLTKYAGPATCHVADCRHLPFADASKDIAIVQGGLHHLPTLTEDLDRTLREARRVLRKDGRFVVVEPWLTPFLSLVHRVSENTIARRLSRKIDAFARMAIHEHDTYVQWLGAPAEVLSALERHFIAERRLVGWGKLMFVGRTR